MADPGEEHGFGARLTPEVRMLGRHRSLLGESPVWHPGERMLWHVDITGRKVVRTDPDTGAQDVRDLPDEAGAVFPAAEGVIVALPNGLHALRSIDAPPVLLAPSPFDAAVFRFNDGTVDADGRILVFTCRRKELPRAPDGTLWRFAPGADPERLAEGFWTGNGLAPAGEHLFLSDSAPEVRTLWRAPYGDRLGARETIHAFRDGEGRPDGAALDAEGGCWMAATEGAALVRMARGAIARRVNLPTRRPSKPVFFGPDLERLAYTSISETPDVTDPNSGQLLEIVDPGVRGAPIPLARLA